MKKKTKKACKILSVFLAFLIVVQILPLQVLAENITDAIAHQQFINDVVNNPTSVDDDSDAEILYEVEEKRDEYTKVYKKSDGSYTAVMTEEPLHYLYNGEWEEINNSMSLNGNLYTNLDNLFNVELPETIDSNENLTVEKDGYELSFSVDEIEESSATVENNVVVSDTNIAVADEAISQTQSSVTYNDVAENTDLQYIVTPNSIKENIIVSDKESVKDTYTFTFETNGLNTEKLDDGSVVFKDENDEVKFRIPRPVMTDSSLAFSYDINVVLIENTDETVTLEYSPSSEWINDSDCVYPITIDPAIHVENDDVSWVEDTWVSFDSEIENSQYINGYNDCAGGVINQTSTNSNNETRYQNSEIYTKFNIDALKSLGNNVVFTEVQYLFVGASVEGKAIAKTISSPTDLTTVTYETKPTLDDEIIDYYTSPYSSNEMLNGLKFSYIHFNLTKPLNEWYNGAENNGFAVVAGNEEYIGLFVLNGVTTSSSDTNTYTTAIVMDYVDMGGYNENYNYHTQLEGKAGTGYVNDFTQQLSVIRDDIYVDDEIIPVTIGMIYDSATYEKLESLSYNSLLAYGNNWIPNYLRAYLNVDENNFTYYTDTGSTIDFIRSTDNEGNVIFTELFSETYGNQGYELEYYPASNGSKAYYIIHRPDGCFEKFNEYGLLTSVTKIVCDEQPTVNTNEQTTSNYVEKSINVTYDSKFRIAHITDSVGRKYVYEYENNLLTKVKCYSTNNNPITVATTGLPLEVNYTYDTYGNLTGVTHPNGESVEYIYDGNGKITSMTLIDSCRVTYTYDDNGRVTTILEKTYNGTEYVSGDEITYDRLSTTQIKITSESDGCKIYQFNIKGNLLHIIDDSQLMPTSISNESNLIENNLEYWTTQENSEIAQSSINNDIYTLEIPGGTDTENIIYQTVSIDGRKNDTIAVSGWLKGHFTKSSTNNTKLHDLIEKSEDPKICNFTGDRYAQIEMAYKYSQINEDNVEETLTERIVIPFSEHISDWQFTSKEITLKGDCNEIIIAIRYSKNANSALLSNMELIQNGGYAINSNDNGQVTNISLDQLEIISYIYNQNNKISSVEYNNSSNQKITTEFEYNDSNKLTQIIENGTPKYKFSYDSGVLTGISSADNRIIRYVDDFGGLSSFNNSYLNSIKNEDGNPVEMFDGIAYETELHNVDYNISDGISIEKSEVLVGNNKAIGIGSAQDFYGRRLMNIVIAQDPIVIDTNQDFVIIESTYGYDEENTEFNTLNQVKTYTNKIYNGTQSNSLLNNKSFFYEYDENDNIIKEYDYASENSIELRYSYEYNEANQLIRYNDNASTPNRSYSYEYDNDGNIVSKSTYSYTPLETELGEPLTTEYYSVSPTSLNGATLTWNGQQLESYEKTDDNNITTRVEYSYDENGLMSCKIVKEKPKDSSDESYEEVERYDYTWAYGKLTNQVYINKDTSTKHTIKYVYDSFNSVQGFILNHTETYLYLKNLYGDIVGLVDSSGNIIVSYEYDIWGVPTYSGDSLESLATILPLAYRGCCYDYDTDLYYMENRYYNPSIGRFISASGTEDDGLSASTSNYSLFNYWENHPLWYVDSNMKETLSANSIANYLYNKQLTGTTDLSDYYARTNGFIFNQKATGICDYRYGFNTVGPYGCGLVATYNALLLLENQPDSQNVIPMNFHDIVREYEQSGLLAYGCFGLHPLAIAQFFIKRKYDVNISFNKFERATIENDANIMYYLHNTGNHYVAIQYNEGSFKGYNTFCDNNTSVDDLKNSITTLRDGKYKGTILISISKK